jgi:hypothetical protein
MLLLLEGCPIIHICKIPFSYIYGALSVWLPDYYGHNNIMGMVIIENFKYLKILSIL